MLLDKEDRQKFIIYLQQSISSDKALISQMGTMQSIPDSMLVRRRQKVAAYMIVLTDLLDAEEQTIEGK